MRNPQTKVSLALRLLLGIFVGGLMLVIGLRFFFADLQGNLSQRSANERARLFVGEEIVRSIRAIEKDIYQMGVTTSPSGAKLVRREIVKKLEKFDHDLHVLKSGGSVRREILLNLEGRDAMIREERYTPPGGEQAYVMELIEIEPLLAQISEKSTELETKLQRRWDTQEASNSRLFLAAEQDIVDFLKHVPPLFARLDENANRLFYDSSERLRELEDQIAVQRNRLDLVETGLITLVIILASLSALIVTQRINSADRSREQALDEARAAKDAAERASRAKSEFVSRMSHELRTPLNAIIGFGQLLESEPLPPSQMGYVKLINSSGNHLMELINAVLDHAKIESGNLTLEAIEFDLADIVESVSSIVLERANTKGLIFTADISPNLPPRLIGDPTRLRQVLINLLVNAVKFTEQGAVTLRIGVDNNDLIFSIRDTGIGMDKHAVSRLFQPFAQADDSITRKYGGTGLGLMISKELVAAMGGSIEVDSAPGAGSCFWVRLPLKAVAPGGRKQNTAVQTSGIDFATLIGGRVLLVDDNAVNQQLGTAMLDRLGLTHDIASDGLEALERVATSEYALILMDMEMPEMDGVTAARHIRAHEATQAGKPAMVIIAMTANALSEDRERCLAAGMNGYVAKPISLATLEAEIARLFGAQEPAGATVAPSAPVNSPNPPSSVAPFDYAKMMASIGDEELIHQLAALYVQDAPNNLAEIEAAFLAADWPGVARGAHTLKSLFATFAATRGELEASQLEQAAKAADVTLCQQLVPVMRERAETLSVALAKL
jgi:signal transduction histidine kinase/CheY-like chemotaxis protein/HPt (histidine-containing phosphotransfer) domain-containing protein